MSSLIYTAVRESLQEAPDWVNCVHIPAEMRAAVGWERDERAQEKKRNDLEEVKQTDMIYKTSCIIDEGDISCRGSSLPAIISKKKSDMLLRAVACFRLLPAAFLILPVESDNCTAG